MLPTDGCWTVKTSRAYLLDSAVLLFTFTTYKICQLKVHLRFIFPFRLQDALDQKTIKTKVMTVTQTLVDGKVVSSSTETKNL